MDTGATSSPLSQPLALPCGMTLPNRIFKAAMAESLATPSGDPSHALIRLYRRWTDSGAGALITGDIGVSRSAADARAVRVHEDSDPEAFAAWAAAVHGRDVRLLGQIFHLGRQAPRTVAWRPVAPSRTPAVRGLPLFGAARSLTASEIATLIEQFASAAAFLQRAGFDGVEVHAAHGYLVGSFLSPYSNRRTDEWGGSVEARARFLLEVLRAIRSRVGPRFAVAVKINASDFMPGGLDAQDCAHVVGLLDSEGVDLIEISGGTYESSSTALGVRPGDPGVDRDAYFAAFAPRLREVTSVPLALTGGLRSRAVMERLLREGTIDAVGLGRPMVEFPDAPRRLLTGGTQCLQLTPPPTRNALSELSWYMVQFDRLSRGRPFAADLPMREVAGAYLQGILRQVAQAARRTVAVVPGR